MLYITTNYENWFEERTSSWRLGDPLPKITGSVVKFQADGDELNVILEALRHWDKSQLPLVSRQPAKTKDDSKGETS